MDLLKLVKIIVFKPWFFIFAEKTAFKIIERLSRILAFFVIHSPLRREIEKNLKKVYRLKHEELEKLSPKYIRKMFRYIFEVINLDQLTPRSAPQLMDMPDIEKLNTALKEKKGVMIVLTHSGNWELFGCSLGQRGYHTFPVVNSKPNNPFEVYLDNTRIKNKMHLININQENMYRSCLKAFKENGIVIIAADTGATDSDKNITTRFLDRQLPIASGWATLARKCGCLVLPVHLYSIPGKVMQYSLFDDIIDPTKYSSDEALINRILPAFESFFLDHLDEWFLPLSTSEVKKSFG
jgi:KDO2-lipid IV(A) lauroyltransferase